MFLAEVPRIVIYFRFKYSLWRGPQNSPAPTPACGRRMYLRQEMPMALWKNLKKIFCGDEPPARPSLPERLVEASAAVAELRLETSLPRPLLPLLHDLARLLGEAVDAPVPVQARLEGALAELENLLPTLRQLEAAGDRAAWSRDLDYLYQRLEDCLRDLSGPLPGEALLAAPENSARLRAVLPDTMQLRQQAADLDEARQRLAKALAGHGPDLRAPEDAADLMAPLRAIGASAQALIAHIEKEPASLPPVKRFLERYLAGARGVADQLAALAAQRESGDELNTLTARSLDILQRLEGAFADKRRAARAGDMNAFSVNLKVLDSLLQMDGL
jgi:hypothetical protein